MLWEISSQTWTRASVKSWTVSLIDSLEVVNWIKALGIIRPVNSINVFIIWENSNLGNVPDQKEVICLNSSRPPKSKFAQVTNKLGILVDVSGSRTLFITQCLQTLSCLLHVLSVTHAFDMIGDTANPLATESMDVLSWRSYTTTATSMGSRCCLMLPVLVGALVK